MNSNPFENFEIGNFSKENYESFDLHRPHVDDIILVSASGKKMKRELDLIDVWFDSDLFYFSYITLLKTKMFLKRIFLADFIAEGVDQTRGWFFTLHISTMLFDSVA